MNIDLVELHEAERADLVARAEAAGIEDAATLRRADLVFRLAQKLGDSEDSTYGRGVLEVHAEGFGFLRAADSNFLPGADDIYVSQSQIRRFHLRTGDTVIGRVRPPKEGERYTALLRVESVNGDGPGIEAPSFDNLTAIYPDEHIPLEGDGWLRAVDLVAPLGLGARGILVTPPRTGRVEMLRRLTDALTVDEGLEVTVLLLAERPEEIQEWRKATRAEVIATPFDEPPARHLQVADIVFERARRLVERGDDVVLVVDSLTRLLRACLAELPPTGRDIGGVDATALHRIRRYLGAARALEEGGSLTIVAAMSGDPTSKLDHGLLEDLHEVVNWELTLSRDLADRGLRPPIDVHHSGTRRMERLLQPAELERRLRWRGTLTGDAIEDGTSLLADADRPGSAPGPGRPALDKVAGTGQ